jgi:hypothetical protein
VSTPSPILVAASPYLKQAIAAAIAAVNTTMTGPPLEVGLRIGPAFEIFVNQLILLEPGILGAEEGVVATDIVSKLTAVAAKLP